MKKIACVLFFYLAVLSIKAQTEKGKIIFASGSNISCLIGTNTYEFSGTVVKEVKSKQFSFEPSIGFFAINNLALGLSIPINYSENSDDEFNTNISSYGIAPFIRYYLSDSKVKPYLNFDIGYIIANAKSNLDEEIDDTYGGFVGDAGIGISAFFSERVAFDTQLSYGFGRMIYNGDTDLKLKTRAFGVLIGFTVTF